MKKKVTKENTILAKSVAERMSHAVRYIGMSAMVFTLALAGINGFAVTTSDCADKGILDYLQTAGGAWGKTCGATSGAPTNSIGMIIGSVIQIFLGFLGIIFLILTLYAGYLWMTAQGEKEKVKKAQDLLQTAVVGLVIIIAAQGLTYWVLLTIAKAVTGT